MYRSHDRAGRGTGEGSIRLLGTPFRGVSAGLFCSLAFSCGANPTEEVAPHVTVVVAPNPVTVPAEGTHQFNAILQYDDGRIVSAEVRWSATGGTITTGGLFTAGDVPGAFTVTVVLDTNPAITASSAVTITPPPSDGPVEPTLLPVASQQPPNKTAYSRLQIPALPAGGSYRDPTTNVLIYKLTSSTVPVRNVGATHDYFEGGPHISAVGSTPESVHRGGIHGR